MISQTQSLITHNCLFLFSVCSYMFSSCHIFFIIQELQATNEVACYLDKGTASFSKNNLWSNVAPGVIFIPQLCTFILNNSNSPTHTKTSSLLSFNPPPPLSKAAQINTFILTMDQIAMYNVPIIVFLFFFHPQLYGVGSLISLISSHSRQLSIAKTLLPLPAAPNSRQTNEHKKGTEANLDRQTDSPVQHNSHY